MEIKANCVKYVEERNEVKLWQSSGVLTAVMDMYRLRDMGLATRSFQSPSKNEKF